MASTTYATAQSGSFAAGTEGSNWEERMNFIVTKADLAVTEEVDDVTGSHTPFGSMHTEKKYAHGLPTGNVAAVGYMYDAETATEALSQSGTFTTPAWSVDVQEWQLRKSWGFLDVTAIGDAAKKWHWASLPTVTISVRGIAKTSDPGDDFNLASDDPSQEVTFNLDLMGAISCTAMMRKKTIGSAYYAGGPVPYSFVATLQNVSSYAPIDMKYNWLFPHGTRAFAGDPLRGILVLDIDATTNISESAVCYDVTLGCRPQRGGIQPMVAKFRWTNH